MQATSALHAPPPGSGPSPIPGPRSESSSLVWLSCTSSVSQLSRVCTTPLTMRGTLTGSLAPEAVVSQFRKLVLVVFSSGVLSGLVLFAVQHFTVIPLIQAAETYETDGSALADASHKDKGWQPANGWERTSLTALATVLTGVGFAAMLFGLMALVGKTINVRYGALWGLAAFACFSLALALGLPPQPPGVAVADLHERQLWWAGTAIATAIGLWLIAGQGRMPGQRRTWLLRIFGVISLVASALVWCADRDRREQRSSPTGPPFLGRVRGNHRHVLVPGRDNWRIHVYPL